MNNPIPDQASKSVVQPLKAGDFLEVVYKPSLSQESVDALYKIVADAAERGWMIIPEGVAVRVHRRNDLAGLVKLMEEQADLLRQIAKPMQSLSGPEDGLDRLNREIEGERAEVKG